MPSRNALYSNHSASNNAGQNKNTGFGGSTLVHTPNGPVPIEQIKAGDWVLSKPENGGGNIEPKRVVRSVVHHDQEIARIDYMLNNDPTRLYPLYAAWEHPFWVQDEGWTTTAELHGPWLSEHRLTLVDGSQVTVQENSPIYRTRMPGVGWFGNIHDGTGAEWDFDTDRFVADEAALDFSIYKSDDRYLKTTVYNLEIEEFHTYFVGSHGVWVHNDQSVASNKQK